MREIISLRSYVLYDNNIFLFGKGDDGKNRSYWWNKGSWRRVAFGAFCNAGLHGKALSAKEAEAMIVARGDEFTTVLP
jgi:hypothetical protein